MGNGIFKIIFVCNMHILTGKISIPPSFLYKRLGGHSFVVLFSNKMLSPIIFYSIPTFSIAFDFAVALSRNSIAFLQKITET
jgi:hypothetical protein